MLFAWLKRRNAFGAKIDVAVDLDAAFEDAKCIRFGYASRYMPSTNPLY